MILLYSGADGENRINGVELLLMLQTKRSLIELKSISDRIMTASCKAHVRNITLVQCYVPTVVSEEDIKYSLYAQLNETIASSPKRDITIVMVDFNAKVGTSNEDLKPTESIGYEKKVTMENRLC